VRHSLFLPKCRPRGRKATWFFWHGTPTPSVGMAPRVQFRRYLRRPLSGPRASRTARQEPILAHRSDQAPGQRPPDDAVRTLAVTSKRPCDYWNEKCPFDITGFLNRNSFYYAEHVSDVRKLYPILVKNRAQVYSIRNI